MSVPRAYQFIALRRISAHGPRQTRNLHMTGPATYASPILGRAERPASNLPNDMAGLRAECKRRKLDFAGTKQDLMSRIKADDLTHSRAFTTAVNASKRPVVDTETSSPKAVRHINTSRVLKAPKDTSTIDFAYLPDYDPENPAAATNNVPIMNFNWSETKTTLVEQTPEPQVMKAEINSMSSDPHAAFSPLADVHDNTAHPIDFHAIADSVSLAASKTVKKVVPASVVETTSNDQPGTFRQLWNGLVEDIRGPSKQKAVV